MRSRLALLLTFVFFTTPLFAKEIWIAVSGTANNVFFSDARVFNPTDHQITIQAFYLPRGNGNNTAETATSFTVPSRQMRVFDDIVATLLHRVDVGAIRFTTSTDDFVVTQRVYLAGDCDPSPIVNLPCTLGQFVDGQNVTSALKKGVVLQLKSNTKFRTNIGGANTTTSVANVTWRLYDKNNAIIATKNETLQPYGVLGPSEVASYMGAPSGSDLSDAWVSFVSDQPILAYGSVVDNVSGDQTYIPASADSGTTTDTVPTAKTVTVVARDFSFSVNTSTTLKQNDQVTFKISQLAGSQAHGFQLLDPDGNPVIVVTSLSTTPTERTIILTKKGPYFYVCTNTTCGTGTPGHFDMTGSIGIEQEDPDPPGRY